MLKAARDNREWAGGEIMDKNISQRTLNSKVPQSMGQEANSIK